MKRVILIIISIFVISFVNAQDTYEKFNNKKYIQRITLLMPGISGEFFIEDYKTINVAMYADLVPYHNGEENNFVYEHREWKYKPSLILSLEYRNYIKTTDRISREKRIDKFSGAYGSFGIYGGIASTNKRDWYISFGPKVGFQRTIGKWLFWNVNIGVGPMFQYEGITFTLLGGLEVGFAF